MRWDGKEKGLMRRERRAGEEGRGMEDVLTGISGKQKDSGKSSAKSTMSSHPRSISANDRP